MLTHSTRSTFTTLPPAVPLAGSVRGLYFAFLTYTAFTPGVHWSLLKMNGPDPVVSSICLSEGVSATRFGKDAAGETLEYFASYLQRLDGAELRRVQEDLATLAGFARSENWPKQQARFFKDFLADFGVGPEGEA